MQDVDHMGAVQERLGAAPAAGGANIPDPYDLPERRIEAIDIVKEFHTEMGTHRVLNGISFSIGRGERMAILGRNGAGKSTLIQILAGVQRPTSGRIERGLRMSWPLALGGGFQGELTGYDNIRFITRIYDAKFKETFDYVSDFTELGKYLYVPVRFYSHGMRMRLAFALSLAIDFECYLIDEVIAVGDVKFQQKCHFELFENRPQRAMILTTHSLEIMKEYCSSALILKGGRGKVFKDFELATNIYATL
jgi:capsular polysaccharide transport system ATP-binding protein